MKIGKVLMSRCSASVAVACLFALVSCSAPPITPAKFEADGPTATLKRTDGQPLYNLEKVGAVVNPLEKTSVQIPSSGNINVAGWAVDRNSKSAANGVDVVIDGKAYRAQAGQNRGDVAEYFHEPAYARAGFSFLFPASAVAPGTHQLSLRVISQDGTSYTESPTVRIEVR
jgi:hypothetical protein